VPIDEWGLTSIGDELGEDDAHVWRASLDRPADMVEKVAPVLSHDEYQRAMRYYRQVIVISIHPFAFVGLAMIVQQFSIRGTHSI